MICKICGVMTNIIYEDGNCRDCEKDFCHKDQIKAYRESHKDQINEKSKAYRESHKDQINEKSKAYYESHKDQIKAYRESHKDHKRTSDGGKV